MVDEGEEEDLAPSSSRASKTPKAGEVVTRARRAVGRDLVTVDIGYKSRRPDPDPRVHRRATANSTVARGRRGRRLLRLERQRDRRRSRSRARRRSSSRCGATSSARSRRRRGRGHDRRQGEGRPQGRHRRRRRSCPARTPTSGRHATSTATSASAAASRSSSSTARAATSSSRAARSSSASATALKDETLKVLEEGVILEGSVKNITDYGAFVDLGGIDGLLHVTDMSWGRVGHPSEVVNVGDQVKVVVLKYDPERERVSLGMKQILPGSVAARRAIASRRHAASRARSSSLTDYGAFVELEQGIEGLDPRLRDVVDEARDASVEGARGRAGGRGAGPRRRPGEPARSRSASSRPSRTRGSSCASTTRSAAAIKGKVKSITDFGLFVERGGGHRRPRARLRPPLDEEGQAPLGALQEGRRRRGGRARHRRRQRAHLARHQAAQGRSVGELPEASSGRHAASRARSRASPTSASSSRSKRASRA